MVLEVEMGNYCKFSFSGTNTLRRYVPDDVIRTIWSDLSLDADIEAEVDGIIDDIEAEIDSSLAKQYEVPVTTDVPQLLVAMASVMVADAVYGRSNGSNDVISRMAESKRGLLESVVSGDIVIAGLTKGMDDSAEAPSQVVWRGGEDKVQTFDDMEF